MWEEPLEWPARTPGARRGGVLRLAAAEDVPTLDPAIGYDTRSWFFEQHLFETLVTYDDAGTLVPLLAERWKISDDGRHYRFDVAPDVVFSDGTPLTATDAAGSIERVLDPETRLPRRAILPRHRRGTGIRGWDLTARGGPPGA